MRKGFTLIELLAVVMIIGVLAAIALPQYRKAIEHSRAAEPLTVWSTVSKYANMAFLEKTLSSTGGETNDAICRQWLEAAGLTHSQNNSFKSKHFGWYLENCRDGYVSLGVSRGDNETSFPPSDNALYALRFELTKNSSTLELGTNVTCFNGTMTDACSSFFSDLTN